MSRKHVLYSTRLSSESVHGLSLCVHRPDVAMKTVDWCQETQHKQCENQYKIAILSYLKVNVDVISKDVHSEKLAGADLAGVLLITVGQQMFVHITSAGEHLRTQRALVWTRVDSPKA